MPGRLEGAKVSCMFKGFSQMKQGNGIHGAIFLEMFAID